jgi:hypothetical protein
MVKYKFRNDDKGLALGRNREVGRFVQIWQRPKDPLQRQRQDWYGPKYEDLVVDKNESFDLDFDPEEIARLIKQHGFSSDECEITILIRACKRKNWADYLHVEQDLLEMLGKNYDLTQAAEKHKESLPYF